MKEYRKGDSIPFAIISNLFATCDFSILIYRPSHRGNVICTSKQQMTQISDTIFEQVFDPSVSQGLPTGTYKCQITITDPVAKTTKIECTDAFRLIESETYCHQ